jgi:amino acid permease
LKYEGPAVLFFIFASLALLAAAGDVRMLVRGGVSGTQRLVRHLWRMCFALFFATGSFFLGQQQVFPAFLRNTKVLFIPAFLPLVLLIFWLIRVRFSKARNTMSMPRGSDVTPYGVSSRQRAAPPAMPASAP